MEKKEEIMRFLGLDIGTTRMKCGVYGEDGTPLYGDGMDYGVRQSGSECYLDLDAVLACAKGLLKRAYAAAPFDAVAVSSLGESFALLDGDDRLLLPPMLYTDARGEAQAKRYLPQAEEIFSVSGVWPQGMYSVYKLLWMKENRPEAYARAKKILLIADYVGYALTGERAADDASASRTGLFDIRARKFSETLCASFGVDRSLFSPPAPAGTVVGSVKKEILREWGADHAVYLVTGGHDQVCAALGAGALEVGECVDGMGTVECVTAIYREPSAAAGMGRSGYPNVPYCSGRYCTYLVNYSCGSLVRWWLDRAYPGKTADGSAFALAESGFPEEPTGLFVLPYFAGASTPYRDAEARGAVVNLRLETTSAEIYKGILEGLCMEMRVNLETAAQYGVRPDRLLASGGGAASRKWLQIKADVTGLSVYPPESKETGVCGAAILACSALLGEPVGTTAKRFVRRGEPFLPDPSRKARYDELYAKYKTLYSALKIYREKGDTV